MRDRIATSCLRRPVAPPPTRMDTAPGRWLRRWRATAALVTFLLPALAEAAQPHSWCVTGKPLIKGDSADPIAKKVVDPVCSVVASCCSSRWSLQCVQKAVAKGLTLDDVGDYCGRSAWTQGPIDLTDQYFPRDYNVVALAGDVKDLLDVQGPVAASGNITAAGFNFNHGRQEDIAAVAGGWVTLTSGTVYGELIYGREPLRTNYVTFVDSVRPSAPESWPPIDFPRSSTELQRMSQAVAAYGGGSAAKDNWTLTFKGTDAEMNVFRTTAADLANTTTLRFDVPAGSHVIVNVSGDAPAIANAGFAGLGAPSAGRTLWNFHEATSLKIESMAFFGSILAPKARVFFRNGSVHGTIVVANAPVCTVELYFAKYNPPATGGCLAMDETWSCSGDTLVDDHGHAAVIKPEAGFLEIAGGTYGADGESRTSPTHRVWYSFHPAKAEPKSKPVAVFFNGGPGGATTPLLFAFNTGPMTLDPDVAGSQNIVANPNSWTEIANLLYIDAPSTGFSYAMVPPGGSPAPIGIDRQREAGDVLRTVLRFLDRHPALQNNKVIWVAESYGAIRATLMLRSILRSEDLELGPDFGYTDAQLKSEIDDYFIDVFKMPSPTPDWPNLAQRVAAVGRQILIQPLLMGRDQLPLQSGFDISVCKDGTDCFARRPEECDPYKCNADSGWTMNRAMDAAKRLVRIDILAKALGVNPKTIEWMKAANRTTAYGRSNGDFVTETPEMNTAFGNLTGDDHYLVLYNKDVAADYPGAIGPFEPAVAKTTAVAFVNNVSSAVATFVTFNRYDSTTWTPAIPLTLNKYVADGVSRIAGNITGAEYLPNANPLGLPRKGTTVVDFTDGRQMEIIMPRYDSGHSITLQRAAAAAFFADVKVWYQANSR